jgi:tetratricopeptide (TPR) repeat protein
MEFESLETEKIDIELELKRLVRSIDLSEKYFLFLAVCNSIPRQKSFIDQLKSANPQLNIEVIFFESPIKSLLHELRQRLIGKNPDAVFVSGLRYSIPSEESSNTSNFLANLNVTRDSFPDLLACPMYLWLPEYALSQVFNTSPDFFSVRSSIFFFDADEAQVKQQTSAAISIGSGQSDALSLAEREQRIINLEELLAEFQSLPNEKRDFQTEYDLKDRLARMFYISAKYSAAELLRKQLIEFVKGKDQQEYARQLNELAQVYYSQGKYDEAIKLYLEAIEIDKKTIGIEHPNYAICLNNLAMVYNSQGKYDEAIKLYLEAIEIGKKTIGIEHPAYAIRLSNLALVYYSQGKYDEAIKLYLEAIEIDKKTIGIEHPEYAKHLNNLAGVYKSQGKYNEAIKLYLEAIEVDKKTIGIEHPDYAIRLNNLAGVYDSQGKYDEAIKLYLEAIEIGKKTIGIEHPEYATRLNNLAGVYYVQGKYQDALPLYEEALRIFEDKLPETHPYIQIVRESLIDCKQKLNLNS